MISTFKGQDNEEEAKLWCENNCVLIIVPHKLISKFQPLHITLNNPAKSLIEERNNI